MVTIYQRCHNGTLQVFPYTETRQFKTYAQAYRYLSKRSYNGSCTYVTSYDLDKAQRLYGDNLIIKV